MSGTLTGGSRDAPFGGGDVTHVPAGEAPWAVAGPEGAEIF